MTTKPRDQVDFACVTPDCDEVITFSLLDMEDHPRVRCSGCGKEYNFDQQLIQKMIKLKHLIMAVRDAEEILGDVNVAVDVHGHTVRIPYRLLLTRLNTLLTLEIQGKRIDFHLRVEPLGEITIR